MLDRIAVFDMDETLICSDFIWVEAAQDYLKEKGVTVEEDIECLFYEKGFSSVVALIGNLFPEMEEKTIFETLSGYAEDGYHNKAYEKEGASDLINKVRKLGYIPVILTANNPRLSAVIRERFDFPVDRWFSTRELGVGKGDSHVYDLIADYYKVPVENMVLFDDAEYALSTAVAAGLKAIRIYTRKEASKARIECPTLMELSEFKPEMLG